MKNFIQAGNVLTMVAPTGGVVSGSPLKIEGIQGIATGSAAEGEQFELAVCGVFMLPKVAADSANAGVKAYLKAGTTDITTVASGNSLIGVFTEAAVATETTCVVRLNGVSV